MKTHGYFLERYGYGAWRVNPNGNIVVRFVPNGSSLSHLAVLYPKDLNRCNNAFVKKRIRKGILKNGYCEDRSKSRKAEFLESLESGKLD